jgi:uncharacterized protein (TIGR03000 family)
MYSLVLAAALTTGGAAAPDCCWWSCGYSSCGWYNSCDYYNPWGYYNCITPWGGWYAWPGYYPYYGWYGWSAASPVVEYSAPGYVVNPASGGREQDLEEQLRQIKEQLRKLQAGSGKSEQSSAPAPARVIVKLPDDARLFVDSTACPLTSTVRTFQTPALRPGQDYVYTIKAEVSRDGWTHTASKRVTIRAGQDSVVDFGDLREVQSAQR